MNKVDIKIVIGSNYGDEGKGLATHYFSQNAKRECKKCLNVMFNGGCQRGHTVELKNNTRHVFHHFGSGTYDSAHTYFDSNFMVNPIFFIREYVELYNSGINPTCFISPDCRVSTPYDMLINQVVERERNKNKHGSCGFGIYETQQRYKNSKYNLTFSQMVNCTNEELKTYLTNIVNDYVYKRIKEYNIKYVSSEIKSILNSEILITNFINDFREMVSIVRQKRFEELMHSYNVIIFEGAQGLELDEDNIKGLPHLTPSKTTSQLPLKRIQNLQNKNIEVCYITRSYFTRHGAGKFPTECNKSRINNCIEDITNVNNEFQESIRYGLFDKIEFTNRITTDTSISKQIYTDYTTSVFVTHLNYTNGDLAGNCTLNDIINMFDKAYLSDSKYSEDVKMEENKWR